MRRSIVITIAASLFMLTLAGCQIEPGDGEPSSADGKPFPTLVRSPCTKYEPMPLFKIRGAHGITPTHSVRVDIFRCVGDTWYEIGGLATVEITATSDAIAQGIVKAGANAPWPYVNLNARLPFEFPLMIAPGLTATVLASASTVLDEGDMISCWVVTIDGRDLQLSRQISVAPYDGAETTVECDGVIEG